MEQLPRLMPRPYSAASTMKKGHVDFVFNTVNFERENGRLFARRGVCTGWLEDLYSQTVSERPKIHVYGRSNQNFRYPEDLTSPVIMIGPGTGVAPFRGFLQWREEREVQKNDASLGPAWLFTGCRYQDADFLFSDDWKTWLESGILTRISSCFSRDDPQSSVKYVQHEIKRNFKDVLDFMESNSKATIFVCGDARNMAKDVQLALVDGLIVEKGIDKAGAESIMADWIMAKRYLQDIWT
ncbi:methionine synthase reductase-like [Tigriopus californicus]|nr:methionine synthase reductase-like [Tigriopus californicus]